MSRSTRWCPTPEQLMILEELYRGGLRTPKAFQIQKLTAHLSLYGKIEGKNVFYWFQNHKARDRQKLIRRLIMSKQLEHKQLLQQQHDQHQFYHPLHSLLYQLPCYMSAGCSPQLGSVEHSLPTVKDFVCKMDISRSCEMEKNRMIISDKHDWRTMTMDKSEGHVFSRWTSNNRPLETLDLFPTTASTSFIKDKAQETN